MSAGPLVVVGDALLDRDVEGVVERVCPDAPVPVLDEQARRARPGGAALTAALAAARVADAVPESGSRRPVVLVTAVGADTAGDELRGLLERAGVEVVDLGLDGPTPEKIRLRTRGQSLLRLDRGGADGRTGPADPARAVLEAASAVVVADYGRGLAGRDDLRALLAAGRAPVVWDPHPRGPAPVPGARLVTPNVAELAGRPTAADDLAGVAAAARVARTAWQAHDVAVTLGERGALVVSGDGPPLAVPARPVVGGDTCGAGDCFSAVAGLALADGALPSEAVVVAVDAAAEFVAAGGAGAFPPSPAPAGGHRSLAHGAAGSGAGAAGVGAGAAGVGGGVPVGAAGAPDHSARPGDADDAVRLAARARADGRIVVATGGCFDVLHAGHLRLLHAARALGDVLVVCVNSDASVRRLKGPGRPVVPEADRAALLASISGVDAVALFDDDTPAALLDRIGPHVWVKGGDYQGRQLPEQETLARWQAETVVVPYLDGRSTTGLLARVGTGSGTLS
ncbi:MAG TPA: PfkB family carbohydrate kinase [Acidimicrobiales bacterium]|nr:PfkB family carbohydrate kinase [Acidimicrobiales bacterium]